MAKRSPHRYSEWVFPLLSTFGIVSGCFWLANQFADGLERSRATLPDLPLNIELAPPPQPSQDGAIRLPKRFPSGKPIQTGQRKIAGEKIYLTMVDLTDPETFLSLGLAHNAKQANSRQVTKGDERFLHMVRRHRAAITVSGTFFSMDKQKRVMGNMVSGGRFLKYSPWENYGTTLGLRIGNRPEMVTARTEGKPNWHQHWFSLTAGPRLLKNGKVHLAPRSEGFTDRRMMEGKALRVAIGFPKHGKKLMLVTFLTPVTLRKEAEIMGYLGNDEAMNLDGGTSVGLAQGNKILKPAGRELTNVIAIYDAQFQAPKYLRDSWRAFQQGGNVVAHHPTSKQ